MEHISKHEQDSICPVNVSDNVIFFLLFWYITKLSVFEQYFNILFTGNGSKICLGDLGSGRAFDNGCTCFETCQGVVNDLRGKRTDCTCNVSTNISFSYVIYENVFCAVLCSLIEVY